MRQGQAKAAEINRVCRFYDDGEASLTGSKTHPKGPGMGANCFRSQWRGGNREPTIPMDRRRRRLLAPAVNVDEINRFLLR